MLKTDAEKVMIKNPPIKYWFVLPSADIINITPKNNVTVAKTIVKTLAHVFFMKEKTIEAITLSNAVPKIMLTIKAKDSINLTHPCGTLQLVRGRLLLYFWLHARSVVVFTPLLA